MLSKDWRSIFGNIRDGNTKKMIESSLRYFYRWRPPNGVKVVEEDWDYLIILDACRYDFFEEAFKERDWLQEGELSKKISRGSTSIEWLNRNFTEYYENIVCVTANPHASPHDSGSNYRRKRFDSSEHFYETVEVYLDEEAEDHGTIEPGSVKEAVESVARRYPSKRIIAHFMQPHGPYIGPKAEGERLDKLVENGKVGRARELYRDSLDYVLEEVEELMSELEGKFVITADHGELIGEYGMHSHPHSIYVPELIEVPWLEIESGERRENLEAESSGLDI